jgi:hypothetical protein
MLRDLRLALVAGVALSTIGPPVAEAGPCHSQPVDAEHAASADMADGSFWLQGNSVALRLEACGITVAAVLSALSAYKVSYSSPIALEEVHSGTYAGSPAQVIAEILQSYNYVIKHDNSRLEVTIYGKKGQQAVPTPTVTQVGEAPERTPAQVSRNR